MQINVNTGSIKH